MSENITSQLSALQASIDKSQSDTLKAAEDALKQVKNFGCMTEEAKVNADKALAELNVTRQELNALKVQLGEAEAAYAALPILGSKPQMSIGEMFISDAGIKADLSNMSKGMGRAASFSVNAAIMSLPATGGYPTESHNIGMISPLVQKLVVRDLLNWGTTGSNSVEYVRETLFTNNAAAVDEGALKPESNITFEKDMESIATIAHWILASKQVLDDNKMLMSYINNRLMYGLKKAEEDELLNGSGVGVNINGLYTQATQYVNPNVIPQNTTRVDVLRLAMLMTELADAWTDGIVLNPADWVEIELLKDTTNAYLMADPFGQTIPRLWGLPVVSSNSMAKNKFLVGAFKMAAQGWDREAANIVISTEDSDNIRKNMVTIRCEERIGLTVHYPQALIKGTF